MKVFFTKAGFGPKKFNETFGVHVHDPPLFLKNRSFYYHHSFNYQII